MKISLCKPFFFMTVPISSRKRKVFEEVFNLTTIICSHLTQIAFRDLIMSNLVHRSNMSVQVNDDKTCSLFPKSWDEIKDKRQMKISKIIQLQRQQKTLPKVKVTFASNWHWLWIKKQNWSFKKKIYKWKFWIEILGTKLPTCLVENR